MFFISVAVVGLNVLHLFFQDKPVDQLPDNTCQEHNNGNGIDGMHHLKVETGGPVGILLPEKIHKQMYKKRGLPGNREAL
jgi:hypothetical protein